jgi:ABC-type branched-subunit amino acid transport system ATPase component
MFIESCQIKNYKGFRESGQIHFTPGFNVVVGQNNAGKTALTEALSLQFQNNPHRSLEKRPEGDSFINVMLKVAAPEAFYFLRNRGDFIVSQYGNESQTIAINRLQNYFENGFQISSEFATGGLKSTALVNFRSGQGGNFWAAVAGDKDKIEASRPVNPAHFPIGQIANVFCDEAKKRLYVFRAERLNIHQGQIGTASVLASDARNLAEVLHLLQSSNRHRFQRFVDDVRTVFPDIQDVAVTPVSNNLANINIWFVDPKTERKDLAIPLSDCGTGIGQVLAMLYVIIDSDKARTILIDEPQSFLHPGAIRKLFEIFKREQNQKHQYIVTTHSPTVVMACSPCNVIMLYRQDNETKAKTIDVNETADLRLFLSEIGARLSDVFGADKILWVEGRTEEICFKRIATQYLKIELLATEIIGVTHVGDLEGRHKKVIFEIYQKLCEGRGLLPPALGFCFDREKLSQADMEELTKDSNGLIQFIPRRMYENYLLNPKGIAAILNEVDAGKGTDVTEEQANEWLTKNRLSPNYIHSSDHNEWLKKVDAAKLLNGLFNDLTETRVRYDKLKHGEKLTDWIIQNSPADFDELSAFLKNVLRK